MTPQDGGLLPARPLAAQAHALRAAAAFIERASIPGLSLTVDDERITIQVPGGLRGPASRAAAVTRLAAAAGSQASRNTPPRPHLRLDPGRRADHRPPHPHLHRYDQGHAMTTAVTVTDRSALAAALRDLKLSGMLETLDARLVQAHAGELGHLDFLQVLCQDEISRRETTSLARRIRRARFEEQATLEGFDFGASPELPAAQIRDLAALRWLAGGESVILYGPVGHG